MPPVDFAILTLLLVGFLWTTLTGGGGGGGAIRPLNISNTKRRILMKQTSFDSSHREISESL